MGVLKIHRSASPRAKRPFFFIQRHRVDDNGSVGKDIVWGLVVKRFHGIASKLVQGTSSLISLVCVYPSVLVASVPCFLLERIQHPSSEPFPSILRQNTEPSKPCAFWVGFLLVDSRHAYELAHWAFWGA